MNVNWQNLAESISQGREAYQGGGFGNPIDTGTINFYDSPMSDLGGGSVENADNFPDIITIGGGDWGNPDLRVQE